MLPFPSCDSELPINLWETIASAIWKWCGQESAHFPSGSKEEEGEGEQENSGLLLLLLPHHIDSVHFSFLARLSMIIEKIHSIVLLLMDPTQ